MTILRCLAFAAVVSAQPLPLHQSELRVAPPRAGWELGMISSVAADGKGTIYLLQRGLSAQPVVAIDEQGKVLREWGKGLYQIPHSIRIDPAGNIWTVDAASSSILKFTPKGEKLLDFAVGEQPQTKSQFNGTADIAFTTDGHLLIADGYGNARVLEYDAHGKRIRQWGTAGSGPGQLHLPHGIAIDGKGVVYVADRENGRIQRFSREGKYLGEIDGDGNKTFSLAIRANALWIGCQPRNEPNGAPGWIMKLDPETGRILGRIDSPGHHSIDVSAKGEVLTGVRPDRLLWFRTN
ncbi:MAG: SMP-30/gluconolactonase/LRE family protein [Bryobacterales bacterium]|nr:SMP-30/gluconolactonase/LRE family protein [Bryobacterales bacterium]